MASSARKGMMVVTAMRIGVILAVFDDWKDNGGDDVDDDSDDEDDDGTASGGIARPVALRMTCPEAWSVQLLVIWPYHNSKLPSPSTYGTPSTLSTVASSSSSTSFPVSNTLLVVRLADGTLHHLVPTNTLTDSSPPSPSSAPPIPIPPPHLRYRSLAPSSDSDLDSPRPASTTAVDSDSDYDSDPNDLHATGTIAVSRVINPVHVFFLQTTINTPLFRGSERTAYVARSQYPIVPGHVIFRFPAVRATTTTPAYPAYTVYGILALVEPTYFVFHVSLIPYVTNYITTLHITPSTE
ncbi:hypothetical protein GSI_07882 [Ganoderma sinense ZZ0214-1]|uniref:Uncharacterized protein n=1 Tax=Ganoderma sinense ZZ0214-1 TaxID=1077348 RepID=A0A2G8S885_9APHY|nr:hypothetical protein GSI_07882 [Ganoderma sinense ZZ0214-1]